MRRKRIVRFVVRLARALEARAIVSGEGHAPIDPSLLPIDLASQPMTFH